MTIVNHRDTTGNAGDENIAREGVMRERPSSRLTRITVATALASSAALLCIFVYGMPLFVASAFGAAIGGGAIALMSPHHAAKPPIR